MVSLRDQIQAKLDALRAEKKLSSSQQMSERHHQLKMKLLFHNGFGGLSVQEMVEYQFLCESILDESKIVRLEKLLEWCDAVMDAGNSVQK